uniref:Uncharacterized protein n=1 Tax=Medicago truncatula TaxID=3880 RepID=I3S4R3_MEDTR|nr:unknown [Medicago truncatula]
MRKGLKLGKGKRLRILMLLSVRQLLSLFSWMSLERFLRKLTLIQRMLRGLVRKLVRSGGL